MGDMEQAITPKSDQLNADDLISESKTIKITKVIIKKGEQPVSIFYEGDNGKPWKPCKSMCRALVMCWGSESKEYVGKSVKLKLDGGVTWAGKAVGGIRIEAMSHISGVKTLLLTATRGKKTPFRIDVLDVEPDKPKELTEKQKEAGAIKWVEGACAKIEAMETDVEVSDFIEESGSFIERIDGYKKARDAFNERVIAKRESFAKVQETKEK